MSERFSELVVFLRSTLFLNDSMMLARLTRLRHFARLPVVLESCLRICRYWMGGKNG